MKNLRIPLLAGVIFLHISGCSNEEEQSIPHVENTRTPVTFELTANVLASTISSRAITPVYSTNGLQVYAYKLLENGNDYEFSQLISFSNMTYLPEVKLFRGNAMLEPGKYKFLPTYGLTMNPNVSLPSFLNTRMTDPLTFSHITSGSLGNTFPEVFLPIRPVNAFRSYDVDLTGSLTETVRDTISRSVSRVDVMFIKATKIDSLTYREEVYPSGEDVFGTLGLGKMELRFTNLNQQMNLFGMKRAGTFNATIDVQNLGIDAQGVTIGTRNNASIVGNENYFRFDSIQTDDIIQGSAHVFGTYLIPNNDDQRTAGLQLYVEPDNRIKNSTSRTINISLGDKYLIPLEQNKVTLIKVYVLRDHLFGVDPKEPTEEEDPDPPVPPVPPTPEEDFAVDIQVFVIDEWEESNHVNQPIEE